MKIPQKGKAKEEIFNTLNSYKEMDLDWQSGKVLGYVYDPGEEVKAVSNEAYVLYLSENGLDPTTYRSLLRLENEVVGMVAGLLQGDSETVGNFTFGGTESLILAVKTARDMARATRPEITRPEMVMPITAHSSFYKAGHLLNVKPVVVPVDGTSFRADPGAMRDAVTDNTILLVGSAPSFAHGVVDPIPAIGALALEKDLLFHVDACVGGFQLAYMRKLGYHVSGFDLSVPGVTSLSVDLHKYGYASRGASIILYKNKDIRRYQFFACASWPGYIVVNPALANSKTGGPLAAAWAVMNYLGDEGYMQIMQEVMAATEMMIEGIKRIQGVEILGQPDMCMFALAATTDKINVYRLADKMKEMGWHLQPQFKRDNSPANLHISLNRLTVPVAEAFLKDFESMVEVMQKEELDEKTRNLYSEIEKLSLRFDDASFFKLAELAGITGNELPDNMAQINMLLEVLPHDISEFMLTEYLNNLMVPDKE